MPLNPQYFNHESQHGMEVLHAALTSGQCCALEGKIGEVPVIVIGYLASEDPLDIRPMALLMTVPLFDLLSFDGIEKIHFADE